MQRKREAVAKRLAVKYGKLWVAAEVFLFVLVGTTVNIGYLGRVGMRALLMIAGALLFRMAGVWVCLLGTGLKTGEKAFTMLAYTPKATVQAAIGGIPLALGLRRRYGTDGCGIGNCVDCAARGICDCLSYRKLLTKSK